MGIAAYNRGTAVTIREISSDKAPEHISWAVEAIDRINGYPKGRGIPFGPVVLEYDRHRKFWWLMRDSADRHNHFAYCYPSIRAAMAEWSIRVTGTHRDQHAFFYRAVPIERNPAIQ